MEKFNNIQVQLKTVAVLTIALFSGSITVNAQKVRIGVKEVTFAKSLVLLHCKMSIQEMSLKLE